MTGRALHLSLRFERRCWVIGVVFMEGVRLIVGPAQLHLRWGY